jgi:hypothetical protein
MVAAAPAPATNANSSTSCLAPWLLLLAAAAADVAVVVAFASLCASTPLLLKLLFFCSPALALLLPLPSRGEEFLLLFVSSVVLVFSLPLRAQARP